MKSILQNLCDPDIWQSFLDYKTEKGNLTKRELRELSAFVDEKRYVPLAEKIISEGFCFAPPEKKLINKSWTGKKRAVYTFSFEESTILKLLAYLTYAFDGHFSDNCYAFRTSTGVKKALRTVISTKDIGKHYCYKLDISNYFNSIDVPLLLSELEKLFENDGQTFAFFEKMLRADECVFSGELLREKRGAMAGTPTSPFLANVYLAELDRHFAASGITYARYSDDIIVFSKTLEELNLHKRFILDFLSQKKLSVNADKEQIILPNQPWSFLGIEYSNGKIDLSPATIQKMKDKIRRKARALYRWKNRNNAGDDRTLRAMIRRFNRKFFEKNGDNDLTWSRWFFPIITTDGGLKEIDAYLQENLRFIATGKHIKSNYSAVPYEKLKELGYKSLVSEYYKLKER